MSSREYFTEDEHVRLAEADIEFCKDLATAVARQMRKFPKTIHSLVRMHLQDSTSLYAPYTARLIAQQLREHDAGGSL